MGGEDLGRCWRKKKKRRGRGLPKNYGGGKGAFKSEGQHSDKWTAVTVWKKTRWSLSRDTGGVMDSVRGLDGLQHRYIRSGAAERDAGDMCARVCSSKATRCLVCVMTVSLWLEILCMFLVHMRAVVSPVWEVSTCSSLAFDPCATSPGCGSTLFV